jgi:hypothetical protein
MAVTATDIRSSAEKYGNVGWAYENAVKAFVNLIVEVKRYTAKPGFFAKLWLDRRRIDAQHWAGVLITTFNAVTDRRPPDASDEKDIADILMDRAFFEIGCAENEGDVQFARDIAKSLGYDDEEAEQKARDFRRYGVSWQYCKWERKMLSKWGSTLLGLRT